MQPKENIELNSSVKVENKGLELPIREKNSSNSDWLTIVLILAVMLVASVRVSYSKYMGNLFQSLVNYSTSFRMFREKNYSILHGAFRLDFLFYITFSVFVYQALKYFKLTFVDNNMILFAGVFILVVTYFYLKKFIYLMLGLLFEGGFETREFLFNAANFNRSLGLVLLPVIALINYYPVNNPVFIVFSGILVVLIFYILLIQRSFSILLRKHFSIFYLFLYLCTLDFQNIMLLMKLIPS